MKMDSQPYPWASYSCLLAQRILSPKNVGVFEKGADGMEDMRFVSAQSWDELRDNCVTFYLIVDQTDGVIVDAKFQAFGNSALIGAGDIVCEMVLRKTYRQAHRLSTELIDQELRDFDHIPAFPASAASYLNLALEALDDACEQCADISLPDVPISSPVPSRFESRKAMPAWDILSHSERLACIRKCIEREVQPYIALDAGGIQVKELKNKWEVWITYQGACTTCPSSTGATLNAIQDMLRLRIHPELVVKPDLSLLNF